WAPSSRDAGLPTQTRHTRAGGQRYVAAGQGCIMTLTLLLERAEGLGSNTAHEHFANDRGRDPRAHGPSPPGEVVDNTDMDERTLGVHVKIRSEETTNAFRNLCGNADAPGQAPC